MKKIQTGGGDTPHEVVSSVIERVSLIKAWRLFLKLTQKQVALKAGSNKVLMLELRIMPNLSRASTLEKIAQSLEQLEF